MVPTRFFYPDVFVHKESKPEPYDMVIVEVQPSLKNDESDVVKKLTFVNKTNRPL